MLGNNIFLPKFKRKGVKVIKCFDYDRKEFVAYLQKKSKKFKGFNTKQLTQLIGNDMAIAEKIFSKEKKYYTINDVKEETGKYNIDLQLQNLDKCHIEFLKNLVIQYYKLNHKTDKIPLRNISQE